MSATGGTITCIRKDARPLVTELPLELAYPRGSCNQEMRIRSERELAPPLNRPGRYRSGCTASGSLAIPWRTGIEGLFVPTPLLFRSVRRLLAR